MHHRKHLLFSASSRFQCEILNLNISNMAQGPHQLQQIYFTRLSTSPGLFQKDAFLAAALLR